MKKRIALEITGALAGGGYRRYTESLLAGLARQGPENEYFLFGVFQRGFPERALALDVPQGPNWHFALERFPQGLLLPLEEFTPLRYQERVLARLGVDLVHGLGTRTPRLDRIPSAVTVHFSGLFDFPRAWDRFYLNRLAARSVRQAREVIAISEFTKREAVSAWGLDPAKVAVIAHGAPPPEFRPATPAEVAARPKEPPFFLFVGATGPSKNARLLAAAFRIFKKRHPASPHRLVLAGPDGADRPWMEEHLGAAGLSAAADFLGPVPPARIHELFRRAFAAVLPSTGEGFALPALEAMACGVPVAA
ncbi:MAG: glycosyltransferase, partial [Elusimicrobia bacterium]